MADEQQTDLNEINKQNMITNLQAVLDAVRADKVVGIAMVTLDPNGSVGYIRTFRFGMMQVIGGLNMLATQLSIMALEQIGAPTLAGNDPTKSSHLS